MSDRERYFGPRSNGQGRADRGEASGRNGAPPIGDAYPSLRDIITDALRRQILEHRLEPGTRLVEDRLAEEFGVSRNPVREAIRSLETEGLVVVAPRRGAIVAALSNEEFREIGELRAALEGLSARLAARRVTPEMRRQIGDIVGRGEQAAASDQAELLLQLNDEFHAFLAEAGHNRVLANFLRSLRERTRWMTLSSQSWRRRESWREHAAILTAIADGDEELASVLASRHVSNSVVAYARAVRGEVPEAETVPAEAGSPSAPVPA